MISQFGIVDNGTLIGIDWRRTGKVVIEQIRSYGMAVGATTFDTVHWSGRFHQAALFEGCDVELIPRREVIKAVLGGKGGDKEVRQAVIELFGEQTKGMRYDIWQAMGLAVCWLRQNGYLEPLPPKPKPHKKKCKSS